MTRGLATALHRRLVVRFAVEADVAPATAAQLAEAAWERAGTRAYCARALAFLLSTRPLAARLLTARQRERGVGALITIMFREPGDVLTYLDAGEPSDCGGLLEP